MNGRSYPQRRDTNRVEVKLGDEIYSILNALKEKRDDTYKNIIIEGILLVEERERKGKEKEEDDEDVVQQKNQREEGDGHEETAGDEDTILDDLDSILDG